MALSFSPSPSLSLSLFVFLPTFLTTQVTGFCPGRVSCLPLLLSINLWQLQQQHFDIMNLLLFKYFIFVMALAGDDSSQYTPHLVYPYSVFVFCFFFFSLFVFWLACVTIYEFVWVSFVLNSMQADFSVTGRSFRAASL